MDDLSDLVGGATKTSPTPVMLGGVSHTPSAMTLARFAAARRFCLVFGQTLSADDMFSALETSRAELIREYCAATGIASDAVEEADAADALTAFFALVSDTRDFTGGPVGRAIRGGIVNLAARTATAPTDGASSLPGSSPAGTD